MWIRQLEARGRSGASGQNFLWKHDKLPLYLMDNHRAALWCWRKHIKRTDKYTLFHLDWHWDAAVLEESDFYILKKLWGQRWLDCFDNFDKLQSRNNEIGPRAMVRWDNYIEPFLRLCPHFIGVHMCAHQNEADIYGAIKQSRKDGRAYVYSMSQFFSDVAMCLEWATSPILVNVDMDYFFTTFECSEHRIVDLEFIRALFTLFSFHWADIGAMTIALSPECCGGWDAAEDACRAAFEGLHIEFPLVGEGKR